MPFTLPASQTYGGSVGLGRQESLGGGQPAGGGGGGGSLNSEWFTAPFIPPPAGVDTTSMASSQRGFPERMGGNLLAPNPDNPSVIERLAAGPATVAERPFALANQVTGGHLNDFLSTVSEHIPGANVALGTTTNVVDTAMQIAGTPWTMAKAFYNSEDASILARLGPTVAGDTLLTNDWMKKNGLLTQFGPISFGTDARTTLMLPFLSGLGKTLTKDEYIQQLRDRGFLTDSQTGDALSLEAAVNKAQQNTFNFGDKAMNADRGLNALMELAGNVSTFNSELALGGGFLRATGLAAKIGDAFHGVGAITKALPGVGRVADWATSPAGKLFGGWGVGGVKDLTDVGAITAETVAPARALELAQATGSLAAASLKGAANVMKAALLPGGGSLLTRFYRGATILQLGLLGTEKVTEPFQSVWPLKDLHDFTQSVLDNHPLEGSSLFATAAAFSYPFHEFGKEAVTPIRASWRNFRDPGRELPIFQQEFKLADGTDPVKAIGGKQNFAVMMDRMRQSIAFDTWIQRLTPGERTVIESVPEAAMRIPLIGDSVRALASEMYRDGRITPADLIQRLRDVHEFPMHTILDGETKAWKTEPIFPKRISITNEELLRTAKEYLAADAAIVEPFIGMKTAVLGRAARMTREDLNMVRTAINANVTPSGKISGTFIRDLFHRTPGVFEDPTIPRDSYQMFKDIMLGEVSGHGPDSYDPTKVLQALDAMEPSLPTRYELWHEFAQRDARTPKDTVPEPGDVPAGVVQNSTIRKLYDEASVRQWRTSSDAKVRDLTTRLKKLQDEYKANFSKRGLPRRTAADRRWEEKAPTAMSDTIDNGGGTFDASTGSSVGFADGYQVGVHPGDFAHVAPGDSAAMQTAARAVRIEYPDAYVGTWHDNGIVKVDPSIHVADKQEALILAGKNGQDSIYDWSTHGTTYESIPVPEEYKAVPNATTFAPIPDPVMVAKTTEIASAYPMLRADQVKGMADILRAHAEAQASVTGVSPQDYIDRIKFESGGQVRPAPGEPAMLYQPAQASLDDRVVASLSSGRERANLEPALDVPAPQALVDAGMAQAAPLQWGKLTDGTDYAIPGGTKGTFSLWDAWRLKAQHIDPNLIPEKQRIALYAKLFRSQMKSLSDPLDNFTRGALSLMSPRLRLLDNEAALAALRVGPGRGLEGLTEIANMKPEELYQRLKGVGGHVPFKGNVANVQELARRIVAHPDWYTIQKGETTTQFAERLASTIPGSANKVANFIVELADPTSHPVGTIDSRMIQRLTTGDLKGELPADLVAKYKGRAKAFQPEQINYRLKDGSINPDVPEHLRNIPADLLDTSKNKGGKVTVFGGDYQAFADALDRAVAKKYGKLPFSGAGAQWMEWDMERKVIEPHTSVWPGASALPQMSLEELAAARKVAKQAGYYKDTAGTPVGPDKAVFWQKNRKGVPKGSTQFLADNQAIIRAYESADVSTGIHELAHVFYRDLSPSDLKIAGPTEKFARNFERYLRDGISPTPQLASVFEKMAEWMRTIYRVLKGTPIEKGLTNDMRAMFDRLLIDKNHPTYEFKGSDAVAREQQRAMLQSEISNTAATVKQLKGDLTDISRQADRLRTTSLNPPPDFYDKEGIPRVHPNEAAKLAQTVLAIQDNFPMYDVQAGPSIMNKYTPDTNYLKNLMIERSALQQRIFDWGPVSKMTHAIESLVSPIKAEREQIEVRNAILGKLIKLGATADEAGKFIREMKRIRGEAITQGVGFERMSLARSLQGLGNNQIQIALEKALGDNLKARANFEKAYGGNGFRRAYVMISEAYNPVIRSIDSKLMAGGEVGKFSRLFRSSYGMYHGLKGLESVAASTRMVAKVWYPAFRFLANPMYHVYNETEMDILGFTMDGTRIYHQPTNPALQAALHAQMVQGNFQARQASRQYSPADVTAGMDETGIVFGMNKRRALIIGRQFDVNAPKSAVEVLKSFAKDDPAILHAQKMYGGTPEDWVNGLTHDMMNFDQKGVARTVDDTVAQVGAADGWKASDYKAMQPLVDAVKSKYQQVYDDLYQMHLGNPDRNRIERVLNGYWMFWPLSYMIKANRWMLDVLTNKAFGFKSNLGGAYVLNQLAYNWQNAYNTNPQFRDLVDQNQSLLFTLGMILPTAPWSDGVSLNRMSRYLGGAIGLWPDYSGVDLWNVKDWSGKMAELGPAYSVPLMADVAAELGKDFGLDLGSTHLTAPWVQSTQAPARRSNTL